MKTTRNPLRRLFLRRDAAGLMSLAVIVCVIAVVYFTRYLFKPNTGLVVNFPEVVYRDDRVVFAPKTPFSPAIAAGLVPFRDAIIEIDGKRIANTRDVIVADLLVRDFDPVVVTVIRDGEERIELSISPVLNLARVDWFLVAVFAVVLALTAFYLILHLSTERAYLFMVLACLSYLVFATVKPFYYESFLSNFLIHSGKITAWLLVFFAMFFPTPRGTRALRLAFMAIVIALFLVFLSLRMIHFYRWIQSGDEPHLARYRALGKLSNILEAAAYVLYIFLLGTAYYRSSLMSDKRMIEWLIAGFVVALLPYFIFDQLPLIMESGSNSRLGMGNLANLFLPIFPVFLLIGLVNKKVFPLKRFLSRYSVYVLLALLTFFFFSTLYTPFFELIRTNYAASRKIAAFLVVLVLFVFLFPLRALLIRVAERVYYKEFFRNTLSYVHQLEAENRELYLTNETLHQRLLTERQAQESTDLNQIMREVIKKIRKPLENMTAANLEITRLIERLPKNDRYRNYARDARPVLDMALKSGRALKSFLASLEPLAGLSPINPVKADVSLLIKNAIARAQPRHAESRIIYKTPEEPLFGLITPQDLITALLNVLENAIEASSFGEVRVSCFAEKANCRIRVKDNGPGIPWLDRRKIFRPLFTTKSGHAGLGLYISRIAIERNGGSIKVHHRKELGTIVELLVPLWSR